LHTQGPVTQYGVYAEEMVIAALQRAGTDAEAYGQPAELRLALEERHAAAGFG
jgi:hypothetical protein